MAQPTTVETVSDYTIEPPGSNRADTETDRPVVVDEITRAPRELAVVDAVRDLDFSGAPVHIFGHLRSGRTLLGPRRCDGNIGWLAPGAAERKAELS